VVFSAQALEVADKSLNSPAGTVVGARCGRRNTNLVFAYVTQATPPVNDDVDVFTDLCRHRTQNARARARRKRNVDERIVARVNAAAAWE
jgi:hypothetical protein